MKNKSIEKVLKMEMKKLKEMENDPELNLGLYSEKLPKDIVQLKKIKQ